MFDIDELNKVYEVSKAFETMGVRGRDGSFRFGAYTGGVQYGMGTSDTFIMIDDTKLGIREYSEDVFAMEVPIWLGAKPSDEIMAKFRAEVTKLQS